LEELIPWDEVPPPVRPPPVVFPVRPVPPVPLLRKPLDPLPVPLLRKPLAPLPVPLLREPLDPLPVLLLRKPLDPLPVPLLGALPPEVIPPERVAWAWAGVPHSRATKVRHPQNSDSEFNLRMAFSTSFDRG